MKALDIRPLSDQHPFGAWISEVIRDNLAGEKIRRKLCDVFEDRGMAVFDDIDYIKPNARM